VSGRVETLRGALADACAGQEEEPLVIAATTPDAVSHLAGLVARHGRERSRLPRDMSRGDGASLGVGRARFVIAETGTAVVDLGTEEDQAGGTLLASHVVLAAGTRDVLDTLEAFYSRYSEERTGGALGPRQALLTGGSRTADIEKILVMPAHGPAAVTILLVEGGLEWEALVDALYERVGPTATGRGRGTS